MKKVSEIFKEESDKILQKDLSNNSGLFFFNYSGVDSTDLSVLRRNLKNCGAKIFITKNSFINLTLKKIDKGKDILDLIDGPTALIFVRDDPIGPSKILTEFAKTHETIKLRGGLINDRLIQAQDFKMLANIPPREVLYQQLATAINGPISKLAVSLNQIVLKLVYALKIVSEKKEK